MEEAETTTEPRRYYAKHSKQLRAIKQHEAFNLRLQGQTQDEIALALRVSRQTVSLWLSKKFEAWSEQCVAEKINLVNLDLLRVEKLIGALWPNAMDGNATAASTILRCLERRAKMLGLDATVKINITNEETDIDKMAADLQRMIGANLPTSNESNTTVVIDSGPIEESRNPEIGASDNDASAPVS